MGFYKKGQVDLNKFDSTVSTDYSTSVDPRKILRDPRFLDDLRKYYREKGGHFTDDKTLVDNFYTDRTWADLNTVGAIGDALRRFIIWR